MDLLDFSGEDMYFDQPLPSEVETLLQLAAAGYADDSQKACEQDLLRAYFLAPEHLSVLVALYRFYYYQHRLEDALIVAERSIRVSSRDLGLNADWRALDETGLRQSAQQSMALTRFLLLALKGAAYLELRLGRGTDALERLETLTELDTDHRLALGGLLGMARDLAAEERAEGIGLQAAPE